MSLSDAIRLVPRGAVWLLPLLTSLLIVGCGASRPDTRTADGKADGVKVYKLYCLGCHGPDGRRGDGPMRIVDGKPKPDAEIQRVVENGRNEMPGWKHRLQADELKAVVEHTQRLEADAAAR
ncbi:MAG: c-type cytochrome [Actinomycetota bacterium]